MVLDGLAAQLQQITRANGYTRDVGERGVHMARKSHSATSLPVIFLLREQEDVGGEGTSSYPRIQRALQVTVLFADEIRSADPDDDADLFLAEIQHAVGEKYEITVDTAQGGTATVRVFPDELSNIVNGGAPLRGKFHGQVTFRLSYKTRHGDPRVY